MGTTATDRDSPAAGPGHSKLGLWDTVCIIVGIVIGSSIFKTPPIIFGNLISPAEGLGIWLLGGILSLLGALCYAELASTYPRSGGDYVYLTRAFGRPVGFLFGWAQLVVVLSSSIGMMAFIFGEYTASLCDVPTDERAAFTVVAALSAVTVLCVLNFFGVILGKWVQDLLVVVKLAGLVLIVVAGLLWSQSSDPFAVTNPVRGEGGVGVALLLVLYAYGGWNDAAFVAADLRNPRHITKALVLGTVGITILYLAVNYAYIVGLGWENARKYSPTIAAEVLKPLRAGATIISLLVMTSALGAINGLIFTGSRVYATLGAEHRVFALLGRWHPTLQSPIYSLLVQAVIAVGMILQVGTKTGRERTDDVLRAVGIPAIPWDRYFGGFDTLFAGTAPVFWLFFLLTGLSVFVLRVRDPHLERPFRLRFPWFPLCPLVFCATCVFGFYFAFRYARWIALIGFVPLALGIPLYLLSSGRQPAPQETAVRE